VLNGVLRLASGGDAVDGLLNIVITRNIVIFGGEGAMLPKANAAR